MNDTPQFSPAPLSHAISQQLMRERVRIVKGNTSAEAARDYTAKLGLALVPIPPINGHPTKGPTGKGWNQPANIIRDPEAAARYWADHPDHNMGVLHEDSGTVSFDVDDLENTRYIFEELGIAYEAMLAGAPRIQGKDGRDKALFAAPERVALSTHKLTWPGRKSPAGEVLEHVIFELRAGRAQDVLPPSIHPDTGKPYVWRVQPSGRFPPLPAELLELWVNWSSYQAMLAELCPWAPKPERAAPKRGKDGVSVIAVFNRAHDVRAILESHGYKRKGKRYLAPGSTSGIPGARLLEDGRVYSSHAGDPLNDAHAHDAFDVFRLLEHGGDFRSAVKAAAELLGLGKQGPETAREPRSGPGPTSATFSAAALCAKRFEPVKWIIPGILPEGSAILAGSPKIGKSWLALDICIAVALGGDIFGVIHGVDQGEALYLALEDNERRLQRRLFARLGGLNPPAGLHLATTWPRGEEGIDQLCEWLAQHPDCRAVFVDTLARFRPPSRASQGLYEQDYAAVAGLSSLAAEHQIAAVVVHHDRKAEAADIVQTISGTQGLAGGVDSVLIMRRNRMTRDAELHVTGRDIEQEQQYALSWDEKRCRWSITGAGKESLLSPERRAILDIVKSHGPICGRDVAAILHPGVAIDKNSKQWLMARRHLNNLADAGLVVREGALYQAVLSSPPPPPPPREREEEKSSTTSTTGTTGTTSTTSTTSTTAAVVQGGTLGANTSTTAQPYCDKVSRGGGTGGTGSTGGTGNAKSGTKTAAVVQAHPKVPPCTTHEPGGNDEPVLNVARDFVEVL